MPDDESVATLEPTASETTSPDATEVAPPTETTTEAAPQGEETPAETATEAPPDLAPETEDAILDLYGDKVLERPAAKDRIQREAQSIADKQIREMQGRPELDTEFQGYLDQHKTSSELAQRGKAWLADQARLAASGGDVDQNQILQIAQATVEAQGQAEGALKAAVTQQGYRTMHGLLMRLTAEADVPQAINDQYNLAVENYNRLVKSGDPQNVAKADAYFQEQALEAYAAIRVAADRKDRDGRQQREQKARDAIVADNAVKAMIAKNGGGSTAPSPGGQPGLDTSKEARQQRLAFGGTNGIAAATAEDREWYSKYASQF